MNDLRGVQIQTGDVIAWPDRRGSNLYMHAGEVTEISFDRLKVKRTHTSGYAHLNKVTTLHCIDRVVVIGRASGASVVMPRDSVQSA